jgi:hypothetical protein
MARYDMGFKLGHAVAEAMVPPSALQVAGVRPPNDPVTHGLQATVWPKEFHGRPAVRKGVDTGYRGYRTTKWL